MSFGPQRRARGAMVVLAAAMTLAAIPHASARARQDAPAGDVIEVFTYSLAGGAAGVGGSIDIKGFLALSPILAYGIPRVSMGMDPTPASSSRAAPIDPGVVGAADAAGPALLGIPPGLIPTFPLYADAGFPQGQPEAEVGLRQEVPGAGIPLLGVVSGRATATADSTTATATVGGIATSGENPIGQLGAQLSRLLGVEEPSNVLLDIGTATTSGELHRDERALSGVVQSRIGDISLLGGLLELQGVSARVELDWPDPEAEPVVKTSTDIGSLRVLGLPAAVTPDGGLSLLGPLGSLLSPSVQAAFDQAGLHIRPGAERVEDGVASATALEIVYDAPTPEIPGVIGSEQPNVLLAIGSASMTFTGELVRFPVPPLPPTPPASVGSPGPDIGSGGVELPELTGPVSPPAVAEPSSGGSPLAPSAVEPTLLEQLIGDDASSRLARGVLYTLFAAMAALFTVVSGRFRLFVAGTDGSSPRRIHAS